MKFLISIFLLPALVIVSTLKADEPSEAVVQLPEPITNHPDWEDWQSKLGEFRAQLQFVTGATVYLFDGGRITLPKEEGKEPVLLLREAEQESLERALTQRDRWEQTVNRLEEERAQRLARGYTGPRPVSTEGMLDDTRTAPRALSFGEIRLSRDWDGSFRLGTVRDEMLLSVDPVGRGLGQPWLFQQDTRPIIQFND